MGANFSRIKNWVAEILTYADLNAEFNNILNNLTPAGVDDASTNATAMRATADPYPASTESLATSLEGELQRIRYVIAQITGKTYWYQDPDAPLYGTLYDANTILAANTDNTPAAVTIAEQRIVGRVTGGNITALTGAEARAIQGTAPFVIGSDADGDIYYRASGLLARLAKGIARQGLRMNSGATAPEWGAVDAPAVPQTVQSAFCDAHGFPEFLWNGQEDFAVAKVPTGDAIQDSYTGSQYGYLAIDGSDSTYWQSGTAYGSSSGVAYLGVKNLKRNIKAIKYLNGAANAAVTSVKVDYSTDGGVTWTNIQTTTVNATASCWQEITVTTYASGDAGLHSIRLLANANPSGAAWTIYTLILLYNSNLDVCTTGNAVKGTENGSYPATQAFDNVTGTYYQSTGNMNTGNEYLGQSGLATAVKAVRAWVANAGCKEVRLSWKQNVGDSWTDLATVALDSTPPTAYMTIVVPSYSPSGSHYFALRPTTNCSGVFGMYEMEFYLGDDTAISMTASATDPLQLVHSSGTDNYITEVTSSNASLVTGLVPGRTHFIYADRNASTGAITYGSTPVCPQYGKEFDSTKHCLLHFEGADGSTVITDEFGSTWTVNGNAQIDNAGTPGPKFGSTYLRLDGTGDSIVNTDRYWFNGQPFKFEFWWFTANNATADQFLIDHPSAGFSPISLRYAGSSVFSCYMSSNNSASDICSIASIPSTVANNTYYKFIVEWDGYYYRVWKGTTTSNMALIVNVKSSTPIYTGRAGLEFGAQNGSYSTNGGFDEIRITLGSNRSGWSPVAEVAAFDKYDADMTYFDINKLKMYYGGGTSWTAVQRLFLGEAYMDAHGVTDMRNYALQGKYDGAYIDTLPGVNTAAQRNHNIGLYPKKTKFIVKNKIAENAFYPGDEVEDVMEFNGSYLEMVPTWRNRRTMGMMGPTSSANYYRQPPKSGTGSCVAMTATSWAYKLIAERGW